MNRPTLLALIASLLPTAALADERPYAFTYEPVTDAAGESEVELYETFSQSPGGGTAGRAVVHELELGRGLTDQVDLGFYTVMQSTSRTPFELSGFKLRGRAKLLTTATAPLDLVLYVEVAKTLVEDRPWSIEEKVIFGRELGGLGLAANLIAEQEFVGGEVVEIWGWSAGAAVPLGRGVRLGGETFGEWKREAGVATTEAFAGPCAVVGLPFLRAGSINSAWLTLGVAFGLTSTSDDLRVRALLGVDF